MTIIITIINDASALVLVADLGGLALALDVRGDVLYMYMCIRIYIYIYTYRERER